MPFYDHPTFPFASASAKVTTLCTWDLLATMVPRLPWRWFPELMWSWHWVPGATGWDPWNLQIRNGEVSEPSIFAKTEKKQHWNLQDFEISRIDFYWCLSSTVMLQNGLKSHWTNSDWCIVWYLSSFVQVESFLHLAMLWHWVLAKGCQAHPGVSDFTRPVDPVVI